MNYRHLLTHHPYLLRKVSSHTLRASVKVPDLRQTLARYSGLKMLCTRDGMSKEHTGVEALPTARGVFRMPSPIFIDENALMQVLNRAASIVKMGLSQLNSNSSSPSKQKGRHTITLRRVNGEWMQISSVSRKAKSSERAPLGQLEGQLQLLGSHLHLAEGPKAIKTAVWLRAQLLELTEALGAIPAVRRYAKKLETLENIITAAYRTVNPWRHQPALPLMRELSVTHLKGTNTVSAAVRDVSVNPQAPEDKTFRVTMTHRLGSATARIHREARRAFEKN